jgi:serine/threonine-protein kinase
MADEQERGKQGDLDMFEGLGLKGPETPAAPPPGAGTNVPGQGPGQEPGKSRVRAPQKTLLGIPGPATDKPALGTTRPSAKLRAAAEAKPIPPPPPRRGSLPKVEISEPVLAPPEDEGAVSALPPTVPADSSLPPTVAVPDVPDALASTMEDDAAATHIYAKSPVVEAEPSGKHLEAPAAPDSERISTDQLLAAKSVSVEIPVAVEEAPVEQPRVEPISTRERSERGVPSSTRERSERGVPSSTRERSERGVPSSTRERSERGVQEVVSIPLPPAPPPAQERRPSGKSLGTRGTRGTRDKSVPAMKSAPATKSVPAAESAPAPLPAPPVRAAVTAKLPKDVKKSSALPFVLLGVVACVATVAFLFLARPCTLVVNVADGKGAAVTRAEVFVDGAKRCDDAPCVVRELSSGDHEVRVAAAGFESPPPRTIHVDGRRDVLADFQLGPAGLTGAKGTTAGTGFKVGGSAGVKLSIDGKEVGPLPQEKSDLEPGEHKLHFSGERYVPLDKTITLTRGEILDLGAVPLKVAKGRVVLQLGTPDAPNTPSTKVYLSNGASRKEVPQLPMAIEFDPSEKWELLAFKDGFEDLHEKISFDDGQADKTLTITLTPARTTTAAAPAHPQPAAPRPTEGSSSKSGTGTGTGTGEDSETVLKINSLPASSIVLDGKPIGVTPQPHVVVAPGSHTVMFVNAELSLKKTITVEVKAGESKAAFARLRD